MEVGWGDPVGLGVFLAGVALHYPWGPTPGLASSEFGVIGG